MIISALAGKAQLMNLRNAIAAGLGIASMSALSSAVLAATSVPVTLNVAVKVSNLMPEVTDVAVKCTLKNSDGPSLTSGNGTGEGKAPVADGAFDGKVTVPITGNYTLETLKINNKTYWACGLFLINADGSEVRAGATSSPVWAQGVATAPLIGGIYGDFPPDGHSYVQGADGSRQPLPALNQ